MVAGEQDSFANLTASTTHRFAPRGSTVSGRVSKSVRVLGSRLSWALLSVEHPGQRSRDCGVAVSADHTQDDRRQGLVQILLELHTGYVELD
jgi:hypothetical protein